jgi:hypothetical protein
MTAIFSFAYLKGRFNLSFPPKDNCTQKYLQVYKK